MVLGSGNSFFNGKNASGGGGTPTPPFAANSAYNGLSVDPITGQIVLGDDPGGLLAALINNREIEMSSNSLALKSAGINQLLIDPFLKNYSIGDTSGSMLSILQNYLELGNGGYQTNPGVVLDFDNKYYAFGDDYGNLNGNEFAIFDDENRSLIATTINGQQFRRGLDISGDPVNTFSIGDVVTAQNGSRLHIMDNVRKIAMQFRDNVAGGPKSFLLLDNITGTYTIGDVDSILLGNIAQVDDTNNIFRIKNTLNTLSVEINGQTGFTGTVSPVNSITVVGGIVTNVT